MSFPFENLDVYKRSIQFLTDVESLLDQHKSKISRSLADQLSRASLSIPLNIAEGNGRWHKADKRQFFWIARGSSFECIPIIEVLKIKKLISEAESESYRQQLQTIAKMLSSLIKTHER